MGFSTNINLALTQPARFGGFNSRMGQIVRGLYLAAPNSNQPLASLENQFDFFIDNVPDPDFALQNNPAFNEFVRRQPDIHAAMRVREQTVASYPWSVLPNAAATNQEKAKQIAQLVEKVLRALPNITEMFRQMQGAVLAGGRGIEFIWGEAGNIQMPLRWVPVDKTKFVMDRALNLYLKGRNAMVWGESLGVNPVVPYKPKQLPDGTWLSPAIAGKFIYHVYMIEPGEWQFPERDGYMAWGRGENTYLYYVVMFSQFVMKFRMKWLERYGFPLTVLYYAGGMGAPSPEAQAIVNSIRGEAIAQIPFHPNLTGNVNTHYKVEQIAPPMASYDAFANFDETWTRPAAQKILLGGGNQMQHGDVGARSATEEQREMTSSMIFRMDALRIAETLTTQLIPPIVHGLLGHDESLAEYYPRFSMEPKEEKDLVAVADYVGKFAGMMDIGTEWLREQTGIPRPKEGEELIRAPQTAGGGLFDAFPPDSGDGGKGKPGKPGDTAKREKAANDRP